MTAFIFPGRPRLIGSTAGSSRFQLCRDIAVPRPLGTSANMVGSIVYGTSQIGSSAGEVRALRSVADGVRRERR
jgi:hypothetical protein